VYRKPTLELSSQGLGKKICLPFGNAEKMGNWVLRRIGGLGGFGKFGEQIEKVTLYLSSIMHYNPSAT
jgi:hypothetical protein